MRRQLGQRLRLRRSPELEFVFDESIAHQDRIEQLLQELKTSDAGGSGPGRTSPRTGDDDPQ